jgi:cytochrome c-type biogenesis protein
MIESALTALSQALQHSFGLSLLAALAWGIASILLSPCHLSSIPLVIGFLNQDGEAGVRRAFTLSLIFSLGILLSIAIIGVITASMGRMMGDLGHWSNLLVAIVFLVFGLYLLDLLPLNWSFTLKPDQRKGKLAALSLGLLFGIGLGPCTFAFIAPVLGVVFARVQTDYAGAMLLLAMFAVGHCGIIVLAGTLSGKVQAYLNWTGKSNKILWLKRACGLLVTLAGVYWLLK